MAKVALVTGGSRGIGASICIELAKCGYDIALNYLNNDEKALNVKKQIESFGRTCNLYKYDISSFKEVSTMFKNVLNDFKNLDVLVNNAGISSFCQINDETEQSINKMINTNLLGAIYCCKEASTVFISNHKGNIINISSIWGIVGSSCESVYCASKGGLISFTKALAKELGPSNIFVNSICPGFIDTDMNKMVDNSVLNEIKNEIPLNKLGNAFDVAKVVSFLVNENNYITGANIRVDGGWLC